MTSYDVQLSRAARKAIPPLSTEARSRVTAAIDELAENPRPVGATKVQGIDRVSRIRVGAYRILYEIDDQERIVRVLRIGHRREVYRGRLP